MLQVTHPFGEFTPDTESIEPVVLLSAGVGITPMIAALNRIAARQSGAPRDLRPRRARRRAPRAPGRHRRRPGAHALDLNVVTFHERPGDVAGVLAGRMELARLPRWPLSETDVYMCGPLGFMQAQWDALLAAGAPAARLHREVFGPDLLDNLL